MRKDDEGKCEHRCGQVQVPTDEELIALNAMREIKREVKSLKERMQRFGGVATDQGVELRERMELLKKEWNSWEEKRKGEAKRRMILLGHEEPGPGDM